MNLRGTCRKLFGDNPFRVVVIGVGRTELSCPSVLLNAVVEQSSESCAMGVVFYTKASHSCTVNTSNHLLVDLSSTYPTARLHVAHGGEVTPVDSDGLRVVRSTPTAVGT